MVYKEACLNEKKNRLTLWSRPNFGILKSKYGSLTHEKWLQNEQKRFGTNKIKTEIKFRVRKLITDNSIQFTELALFMC